MTTVGVAMPDHLRGLSVSTATSAERPLFAQLLQLYLHDFSEFAGVGKPHGDVDAHGLFQYTHLDAYWTDSKREPLLFRVLGQIVGFALVNDWSASGLGAEYGMAEFFVLRKYRRLGLGKCAVHQIIQARPGIWEVPVADYNRAAFQFWRSAVECITDLTVAELPGDGKRWRGIILRLMPGPKPL